MVLEDGNRSPVFGGNTSPNEVWEVPPDSNISSVKLTESTNSSQAWIICVEFFNEKGKRIGQIGNN